MAPRLKNSAPDPLTLELVECGRWADGFKQSTFMEFVIEKCGNRVEVAPGPGRFALLHTSLMDQDYEHASLLLRRGANPHYLAKEPDISSIEETPTTLMLYTAEWFYKWVKIRRDNGFDLTSFVIHELETDFGRHEGWSRDTFLLLFEREIKFREEG